MSRATNRQYRSGSVYQRGKDGLWIGTFEAGQTRSGGRRRITVSAHTEAAAKRKLADKIKAGGHTATNTSGVDPRTTVAAWAERWLAIKQRYDRPHTWGTNNSYIRNWVIPIIGKKRLDQLAPSDIRAVSDALMAPADDRPQGRSSSTARRVYGIVHKMLKDAEAEGHAVPRTVFAVKAPGKAASGRIAIPLEAAHGILLAAAANPHTATRWAAALLQGMRQGEALGLTWDCVDLENSTADISWQLQPIPYEHGCPAAQPCGKSRAGLCPKRKWRIPDGYELRHVEHNLCLVRPKTAKGKRVIPMVPWMTAALQQWKAVAPQTAHRLVWPDSNGHAQRADDDRQAWYALQDAATVSKGGDGRYMLHEARHSTATLLRDAGVDREVIKAILGHSDFDTTLGYIHESQASRALARKAMEDVAKQLQLEAG